jgi:hypothetical protein
MTIAHMNFNQMSYKKNIVTGICVDRTFMMIVLAIIDCDGGSFKNLL